MSTAWLPPYLGTWDELVKQLLHNPFLGGGTQPHHLLSHLMQQRPPHIGPPDPGPLDVASFLAPGIIAALNPQPLPPRSISSILVAQVALKDLSSQLPREQGGQLTASLEQTIADEIDFICGTPPRPRPWPSEIALVVATELNLIANSLQAGNIQKGVAHVAVQIMQKAMAAPAVAERKAA